MSVVSDLFAGGVQGVLGTIGDIIGRFKANPDIMAKAQADIAVAEAALKQAELDYETKLSLAQVEINKIEAASPSWVSSNWRPFVGWICGTGLAMASIVGPLFTWISGWIATGKPGPFPTPDMGVLMPVLIGMLGIGGMRSFDKLKGTARV